MHRFSTLSLAAAVSAAMLVACASEGEGGLTNGSWLSGRRNVERDPGAVRTDLTAKQLFVETVQPILVGGCGSCHAEGGSGPTWVSPSNADASYMMQFARGYVTPASAIIAKAAHEGGYALNPAQQVAYLAWVDFEAKERGDKAPEVTLAKLGACMDPEKFKAIGLDKLVTTARTATNNPNKYVENANECTGCNAVPCSTCHSSDPASGFVMAIGNTLLPDDHTFNETKSLRPAYLQKYFGLTGAGEPAASHAIATKAKATLTAKPYTHPLFSLPPATEKALDAFVDDAIARFRAGSCGK
jgi:hypothetical protein